jgi:hypothetical protein
MARIKNYVVDGILSDNDKVIGTDVDSLNQTKNYKLSDIRSYVVSGLSPEIGGTFKISEVVYEGELETPEEVANELDPSYIVSAYENLFFNVNGDLYLLNKTDINIGVSQTALTSADFIEFPTSVGPTGATGNGISSISLLSTVGLVKTYRIIYTNSAFFDFAVTDGTNGTNGTNYTANNLQRTVTASTTILETDNNSTIIINNGATAINITVPTGLSSKFAIGFIQQGTADVTFVPSGTTINSPLDYLKIKGENYWAYLEKVGTSEVFQLAGEIKE